MKNTKIQYPLKKLLSGKITGGGLLMLSTLVAIVIVNSPIGANYLAFWDHPIVMSFGNYHLLTPHGNPMTFVEFINDALMTIFFFSVGLEIKREALVGELSSLRKATLPILAACGGMIVPVVLYFITSAQGQAMGGVAIPMATDIAFSLGVLSLFGKRVPTSLKVFLITLAVADDIGGILVIAIFFSGAIAWDYVLWCALFMGILCLGGFVWKIPYKWFYIIVGAIFWAVFIKTGIHPTIAGVLIAFTVPARPRAKVSKYIETIRSCIDHFPHRNIAEKQKIILSDEQIAILKHIESASDKVISPLQALDDSLHHLVNYFIIPLFALANAGVLIKGISPSVLFEGVTLSIIVGLVLGKFIGILSFSYIAIKLKLTEMPQSLNWKLIGGVAILGGIGFTVSLFIANLSFEVGSSLLNNAKLGIVAGSALSGILGYIWLNKTLPRKSTTQPN